MHYTLQRAAAVLLIGSGLLLAACDSDTKSAKTVGATEIDTPARPAAYVCPMGCEGSESDKPGKCPVCQMDLVANPAATPTGSDAAAEHIH